ncbi:hypothetical protein HDV03_002805 [Kappamyces sp. JEL0829]|nr:hypothetical protein HDV03_002805 [Kappamyces sp. JEL0829]
MNRQDSGYYMVSALFIGFGLHDALSSIHLLVTKARGASHTTIWRVSVVVWLFLMMLLLFQGIALDYYISPYASDNNWLGHILLWNFVFHGLVSIGVSIMLLLRIKFFYSAGSNLFRTMVLFGALFIIFNTAGDVVGIMTAINEWHHVYLAHDQDPLFWWSRASLAVGFCLEAVFTTIGSLGFLYAIAIGGGRSRLETLSRLIFQKDGIRLVAIVLVNFTIAILAIHSLVYGFNFINRACMYLPSWSYGLQFGTFVKDSYVSATKIVQENSRQNSSNQKSQHSSSHTYYL